jgi:alpha-galactosidase
MQRRKIVIIGAGSAVFTQGLVADLILTARPWRLGLVDIDAAALAAATGMSRRMVEAKGADIVVDASTDRRDLLPGADVVVTTVGVGGRRAWEADVFIPRRYGIFQPVGDTVMPGGISRAMRMVPAMVDIASDVMSVCPEAAFYNYANPMTVNCWAMRRATGANVVGLCHGVMHVERDLAHFVGAPPAEVTSLAVGLNHLTWLFDLRWRGVDLWPAVRARLAQERGQPFDKSVLLDRGLPLSRDQVMAPRAADNPFSWQLFATYGAYPAVHDRHVTEFFPQAFSQGEYGGKTLGVDAFSFEDTIARGDASFASMARQATGEAPLDEQVFQRAAGEHEQLVAIMQAVEEDSRRVFSANLRNGGCTPALPADAILEMPAAATASGFRGLQTADFPADLAALLKPKIECASLTVDAALTGNVRLLVDALLADGAVRERVTAQRLADDLLAAQRAHLPQFA